MKIAFVEDGAVAHENIRRMLALGFAHAQLTAFQTLAQASAFAIDEPQDYWLVDLGLPDGTGIDLIKMVRKHHPHTHILVLTVFGDADNIVLSIQAGANGYLLKEDLQSDATLPATINAIENGGTPLSPLVASRLLKRMQAIPEAAQPNHATLAVSDHGLAPREVELLQLMARGYSYQEAAGLMQVSISTVQTLIKRTYSKLAVNTRTQAVFEARVLGVFK